MSDIGSRLFVVGCARSGTTLLQVLLAAHPAIASFPETHFFATSVGLTQWRRFAARPKTAQDVLSFVLNDCCVRLGISRRDGDKRLRRFLHEIRRDDLESLLPGRSRSLSRNTASYIRLLDTLTFEQGKRSWVEKTPNNLDYIDIIERFVNQPRFIHIVRSGADNVASLYDIGHKYPKEWGRDYVSLDRCITRWKLCVARTRQHLNKENHLVIRYERLVENPRAILMQLCAFAEVPFDEAMLTQYAQASRGVVLAREPWKADVTRAIQTSSSKFESVFDDSQRLYVLEQIATVQVDDLGFFAPARA